eukprot:14746876-Ditylum_brightwellii.AAC.1
MRQICSADIRKRVKFILQFQEWGNFRFCSIVMHAAPDMPTCKFKNGVLLVIPSLKDEILDLTTISLSKVAISDSRQQIQQA